MAVYVVTGKLGSGKGKAAMHQLRVYLRAGKRVATNCDVFLENLMPDQHRGVVIRIPDKPSAVDLYMIGSGNRYIQFDPIIVHNKNGMSALAPSPKLLPGFDESHNGALILDECGSWLNTRNFQDKGRAELLEWAIHARKYGWDVYFLMQNISQADKQLRDSLFEYVVRLNRLDRMKIPVISSGIKLITAGVSSGALPRLHIGVVRLGSAPNALVADRWIFRGDDLNNVYNTTQVFSDSYPHGAHSLLSAWHLSSRSGVDPLFCGPVRPGIVDHVLLRSRVLPPPPPHKHMIKIIVFFLCFGVVIGFLSSRFVGSRMVSAPVAVERVYSERLVGVGLVRSGPFTWVTLSDGRVVNPLIFNLLGNGWEAMILPNVWVRSAL